MAEVRNVFNMSKISAQSLHNLCAERVKVLINNSFEGIGYFKKLCDTLNKIAAGRIGIAEITHKEKAYETNKSKTTNKKENHFGNDKSKTTNEEEKTSRRSKFRISNLWKRRSNSKINTTSQHNKSSTQNTNKKASKNIKSRLSNMWKRLSGSRNKTKN